MYKLTHKQAHVQGSERETERDNGHSNVCIAMWWLRLWMVKAGLTVAGLFPFNQPRLLARYTLWEDLSKWQSETILAALPRLKEIARRTASSATPRCKRLWAMLSTLMHGSGSKKKPKDRCCST